jgi:hypothetical protein
LGEFYEFIPNFRILYIQNSATSEDFTVH